MKENSAFFPLTNPSERPDKGRRLAASEPACQNPAVEANFGPNRRLSGECRFQQILERHRVAASVAGGTMLRHDGMTGRAGHGQDWFLLMSSEIVGFAAEWLT
jgi:hypothetical protein